MTGSALPHRDEVRILEDHHQTEHKLDLVRRYIGAYLAIVARARLLPNHHEAWIVDTHAGAGLHRSRDDSDGRRAGSPLIACNRARLAQRLHKNFRVHIRAIDRDQAAVQRLSKRIEPFLIGDKLEDRVDVKVVNDDFANQVPLILAEASAGQALSLWFIDPYGYKEIPYQALRPLLQPGKGPELLINLDLTGMWRKVGAALAAENVEDLLQGPDEAKALRSLYGGMQWRGAIDPRQPRSANLEALAIAYKERFQTFQFRNHYPLRSSDGQIRFMIHLAHASKAQTEFARCYESSLNIGLLAGRSLDHATRSQSAHQLFEAHRGSVTAIEELFEIAASPLNRGQLRVVLREAQSLGFGTFNETSGVMRWANERQQYNQSELPLI